MKIKITSLRACLKSRSRRQKAHFFNCQTGRFPEQLEPRHLGAYHGMRVFRHPLKHVALLIVVTICLSVSTPAADVGGMLTKNTVWSSTQEIHVTNNVVVPDGLNLVIERGTLVRLRGNTSIIAQAGGTIRVEGTAASPVLFRSQESTNVWGRIGAEGSNAKLTMLHADVQRGQVAVLNGADGTFEFSSFYDYTGSGRPFSVNQPILLTERASAAIVRACSFRNYYETLFRFGVIVVEDSLFENATGDAIDFDAAEPGSVIRRCTFLHGLQENVDAVDLGSGSRGVLVENCLIDDFPFDKGVSIGEASLDIMVRGCFIAGVDIGVAIKDSSGAQLVNNTIVNSNVGFSLYEKWPGQGGGQAVALNNILWNNATSIMLADGSTIDVAYCDISGEGVFSGDGNLNVDPLFRDPVRKDFRLATGSPLVNAGFNGSSVGALFPVGSFLVDTDGDDMPDTWEMLHDLEFDHPADALLDADGDGLSNLTEFQAGANPRDASDGLRISLRRDFNGEYSLVFMAVANKQHTIEFRNSVTDSDWETLAEISPEPIDRAWKWAIRPEGTTQFYRFVVQEMP